MNVILNVEVSRTVPKGAYLGTHALRYFSPCTSLIFSLLMLLLPVLCDDQEDQVTGCSGIVIILYLNLS